MPMVPSPPGLFSTMTVWPSFCCSAWPIIRPMMSATPPGAKATTSLIRREGYRSAAEEIEHAPPATTPIASRSGRRCLRTVLPRNVGILHERIHQHQAEIRCALAHRLGGGILPRAVPLPRDLGAVELDDQHVVRRPALQHLGL